MNWRIDVSVVPFVAVCSLAEIDTPVNYHDLRRKLSIWVTVPLSSEEIKLFLGKVRVNHRQCDAVEGRVPGREEGIFP